MTTTTYRWAISAIADAHPVREDITHDLMQAWTDALRAARECLLEGWVPDLKVSINGLPQDTLIPHRDPTGALDADELTASLVQMHQTATAPLVADWLITPAGTGPLRPVDSRHRHQPPTLTDIQRAQKTREDEEWATAQIEILENWRPPAESDPTRATVSELEVPNDPAPWSPYDLSNEPRGGRPGH